MSKDEVTSILNDSRSQINFRELKLEILKDLIVLVSPVLDLQEVAKRCAEDDTVSFQTWLKNNLIQKPSYEEMCIWKDENKRFDCCLVKPFVFLQASNIK